MTKTNELVAQALQKVKEIEERMGALAADGLLSLRRKRKDTTILKEKQWSED